MAAEMFIQQDISVGQQISIPVKELLISPTLVRETLLFPSLIQQVIFSGPRGLVDVEVNVLTQLQWIAAEMFIQQDFFRAQ